MGGPLAHHTRTVRRDPRSRLLGLLRHRRDHAVRLRVAGEPAGQELRAGRARRPPDQQAQLPPAHEGLPGRRVDADPAARPGGRGHALVHLLRLPVAVHRHRRAGARPSAPRQPQVPPRRRVPGLRVRRRPRRRGVHRRHRLGHRPALPRAPVPHPHQDQARGRGHPRHVPRDRAHRLLHRGVAHRGDRSTRRTRSGRSSATRCPRCSTAPRPATCRTPTPGCGASTSPRSSRS